MAASAEYLPSGRYSSNVLTGTSGTVLNVLLVIPALLMNVLPVKIHPDAIALQHHDQSSGTLRRRARRNTPGPDSPTGSSGVEAFAIPTIDAAGHAAGFASNVCAGQAFCNVVNRDGQLLGQVDLDLSDVRVAAERPRRIGELHVKAGAVAAAGVGACGDRERRFEREALQPPTANGLETVAIAFWLPGDRRA